MLINIVTKLEIPGKVFSDTTTFLLILLLFSNIKFKCNQ